MIKWYCHTETGLLTTTLTGGAVARLSAKRNTTVEREIVFHDGSAAVDLAEGATGLFLARATDDAGVPTGVPRLWDTEWDPPTQQGAGYVFRIPFYGAALDGLTPDDKGNLLMAGEIHFENPDTARKSQTLAVTVEPPVYGEELFPDDPEAPFGNLLRLGVEYGNLRITQANGMEIRDTVSGVWRAVSFADGQIVYDPLS